MRRLGFVTLILLSAAVYLIWTANWLPTSNSLASLEFSQGAVMVEIADEPDEREQGLSGRESLAEKHGMLFIFETSGYHGFWMKDMRFSIDIVWMDDNWRVVDIHRSIAPSTYPTIFKPKLPARYVLELNAGAADSMKIDHGQTAVLSNR